MENRIKLSDRLITEYYEEYRQSVFFYMAESTSECNITKYF